MWQEGETPERGIGSRVTAGGTLRQATRPERRPLRYYETKNHHTARRLARQARAPTSDARPEQCPVGNAARPFDPAAVVNDAAEGARSGAITRDLTIQLVRTGAGEATGRSREPGPAKDRSSGESNSLGGYQSESRR